MIETRRLVPELLDHLPADDPRAMRSRQDLRRVNGLMFNAAYLARAVSRADVPRIESVLDLGSGDGALCFSLARRLRNLVPNASATLVDRQNLLSDHVRTGFNRMGWSVVVQQADIFEYLEAPGAPTFDLIVANLVLHHFEGARLNRLLKLVSQRTSWFLACEPERTPLALAGSKMLWAVACNDVTRHDAQVSVRAGFQHGELSAAWPPGAAWKLSESRVGPFSHLFEARRVSE